MQFTLEVKGGMYIYKGPRGHGGITYSLAQVNQRHTKTFGAGGYELKKS